MTGASDELEYLAQAAGLRHLSDDRPGIRRERRGRGFSYRLVDGSLASVAERARIEALAIPPAWTDVWIAPESDAHLLATGRDDRGRKQYLYHADWRAAADLAKFEQLRSVGSSLAHLRHRVDDDLRRRTPDWRVAAVVRLIDRALIRPGSRRHFTEHGSVGATTLGADHVRIDGRRITLEFEGKSAVEQHIEVVDLLLARRLSELMDLDQPDGLFEVADGDAIDGQSLNDYIASHTACEMTAKTLRTWGATCAVAGHLLGAAGKPGGDEDGGGDRSVRRAIEFAAERLGNSPAVCRASYVAPKVLDAYERGDLHAAWRRSRRAKWLSRTEQAVRRVLDHEIVVPISERRAGRGRSNGR